MINMGARVLWMLISLYVLIFDISVEGGGVFKVQHKYSGQKRTLGAIKKHDIRRHGRSLAGINLPLGGNGRPTDSGLYYTKIGIGTPSNDYFVHVDTGSDIFWVNCLGCQQCPKKSDLGIDLKLYNPRGSSTGRTVGCEDQYCQTLAQGPVPNCSPGAMCQYVMKYGDGSATGGYIVKDVITYNQVSGNLQITSANASVTFGCSVASNGNLAQSTMATDGILGFGQSSTSVISQLASAKKVRKIFAHCLDSQNGGIFAIGNVVQPKVQTTPIVPNQTHYNINLENIQVGKDKITADELGSQTVIDSGTTLAYLPQKLYDPLISKILAGHSDLQIRTVEDHFSCFDYKGSVDDNFPTVTFQFKNSVLVTVYPHEYLFKVKEYGLCIGWQNSAVLSSEVSSLTILGDLVLSNKVVVYDLEKQVLGFANYNCSSNIEIQDDQSGSSFQVASENLSSSAETLFSGRAAISVLVVSVLLALIL